MKNFKRIIASIITFISLLAVNPVVAHAEWKQDSTGWWYTESNSYATGWRNIDGNWFYFNSNGYMAHDCYIGNYYLNSYGAWTNDIPTLRSTGSTSSSTVNNQSQTAYLSATGSKYHSKPNCGNMNPNKATKTTVSEAEREGYGRCSKCW